MKYGKLKISRDYIKDAKLGTSTLLYKVFTHFIPLYIEDNPCLDYVVYYGTSEHFDIIKEGEIPPFYDVVLTVIENDSLKIEFKRLCRDQ